MGLGAVVLAYTVLQTQSGATLHWSPSAAPYSINQQCSPDIADKASCIVALEKSFDAWNAAANFHYHTDCLTPLDVASINPSHTSGNEKTDGNSIVTWVQSSWPYGGGVIAITFNWFDPNSGVIAESDMMANGQDYTWTDTDTGVQTDVENFLTHEAGHYLGMGHSTDPQATMYATGQQGETLKRTLDADDIAGVQSIYGAGSTGVSSSGPGLPACSVPPPADSPSNCKCSTTSGAPRGGAVAGVLGAVLAAGIALIRRRRRAHAAAAIAALGVVAFAGSARATTMRTLSIPELAADADTVIVGTISDVRVEGDSENVHTVNTVVVHELVAGRDFGTTLRVVTPGGELGSLGVTAAGIPRFTRGEEVVLFAKHPDSAPADVLVVPSLAQSAFEVVRGTDGVELRRNLLDVLTVERAPDGRLEPTLVDPLAGLTLDALRAALR